MVTTRTVRLPENVGADYGQLLFDDGVLIAVVACVSTSQYLDDCQLWHIECSFLPNVEAGLDIRDLDAWISAYEDQASAVGAEQS